MNYSVFVNGKSTNIYKTNVFPMPYNEVQIMEYTQFQMNQPVDLRIESKVLVNSAIIRPLSLGLEVTYKEHEICIHLEKPQKFSLEINGSYYNNLVVLAEPWQYEDFDRSAENVIYFKQGIHTVDILKISKDNTTLYLEEGAFLNGKIELEHCNQVTICGYGTISMEKYPLEVRDVYNRCVDAMFCRKVLIKDITIADSNGWSLRVFGCDDVTIDNVKIFGCRGNSDGIDICGSKNVLVNNVFTRVWDDSLVVKAFDTGDLENVIFKDSILWNDFARPMEVGVELRAEKIRNVRFENIDVIHSPTGYPLMGIHHGDRAEVSDIHFENIRIENTPGAQLFDIRITDSVWNKDKVKGGIKDIFFKDIYYIGNPGIDRLLSNSRLQGFSKEAGISNVTFENINILGKVAVSEQDCGLLIMDYVDNVTFYHEERAAKIERIDTGLSIIKNFALDNSGFYTGDVRVNLRNTSKVKQEFAFWLEISPAHTGEYNGEVRVLSLEAGESRMFDYEVKLPPGKFVLAVQSDNVNVSYAWKFLQLDWVLFENKEFDLEAFEEENLQADGLKEQYLKEEKLEEIICNKDELKAEAFKAEAFKKEELKLEELKLEEHQEKMPELEFINFYNIRTKGVKAFIHKDAVILQSDILKDKNNCLIVYTAVPVKEQEGEVLFSVEETDFGVVPAVLNGKHGLELAPQLRCPLEITLVFKNEPKVKEIRQTLITGGGSGIAKIPFPELGLEPGTKHFWMEIEAQVKEAEKYRYPYTLFHSVMPKNSAHMFANVIVR